jgi:hypothetical protein
MPTPTSYPISVVWNGLTFDKSTNGLLRVDWEMAGQPLEFRSGGNQWPTAIDIVNKGLTLSLTTAELPQNRASLMSCSSKADAVVTLQACGSTVSFTAKGMILVNVSGTQDHATWGEAVLTMVHVSTDGTSAPIV